MTDRLRLSSALLLSALLHATLMALLPVMGRIQVSDPDVPVLDVDLVSLNKPPALPAPQIESPPEPVTADLSEPEPPDEAAQPPPAVIPLPEQQIVAVPDAGKEEAPENTRFLSERNVSVEEQMVRRGEPSPGDPSGRFADEQGEGGKAEPRATKADAVRVSAEPATEVAAAPSLDALLPKAAELARQSDPQDSPTEQHADSELAPGARNNLLKYGEPWRPTSHRRGTLDFIPDVREGDITLLNTKAELFAPFVRRVGLRVFQNLVILLRRDLDRVAVSGQELVSVEAVMDPKGELLEAQIKTRSATSSFGADQKLQRAIQEGFFDRNPPRGAESDDGNIHFLLTTRVYVMTDQAGRPFSYQAIFSAGLL